MLDINANRRARKWTRRELAGRLIWAMIYPLFRLTPRPFFWGLRNALLRLCGASIGRRVHIDPSVRISIPWNLEVGDDAAIGERAILYALGKITIGPCATISQYAHLCAGTHDWREASMPLLKRPIGIGQDAWICADAFVGPGVLIGEKAIAGACAVVMHDVPPGRIVAGNPAREIGVREMSA
jgi:putative colanic acid biosynthesis acetyltransferase WcaF